MYTKERVVIVAAVVFVVCALLFCNATSAVEAHPASTTLTPTTTLTTSNSSPAVKQSITVTTTLTATITTLTTNNTNPHANQSFTLSGTLTANGTPLSGKTITLKRVDPSGQLTQPNTTTTATNGTYTFTRSDPQGVYTYSALFLGDTAYAPSHASCSVSVGA